MDLRHLAYLVALVREEHFGRAARACHVSQPTLSSGIRRLESEVGLPDRPPLPALRGADARGRARARVGAADPRRRRRSRRRARAMRGGLVGPLTDRRDPDLAPCLSLLTTPLCAAIRGSRSRCYSLNSRQIERGLHDFELELGVTYLDSEPLTGVRTLALYEERYMLLTAETGHRSRSRRGDVGRGGDAAALPPDGRHAEPAHRRRDLPRGRRRAAADDRDELDLDALSPTSATGHGRA